MTIIIILVCFVFYQFGGARWMLEKFKIKSLQENEPTPPPRKEQVEPLTDREKLEKVAGYIVQREGHPADTVKYMSDALLMALINDYTSENK